MMNTPEAFREAAAGKVWDKQKRVWIDKPSQALAIEDPVYAQARQRYQRGQTQKSAKEFPFYYETLGVAV
jgi:hypothetical protein